MDNQVKARSAGEVRQWLQRYALGFTGSLTPGQRGSVMKYLCEAWPDSNLRHQCYGWMFSPTTGSYQIMDSKALTDSEVASLKAWIDARQIGDQWFSCKFFFVEATAVAGEAVKAFGIQGGQMELLDRAWDLDDL